MLQPPLHEPLQVPLPHSVLQVPLQELLQTAIHVYRHPLEQVSHIPDVLSVAFITCGIPANITPATIGNVLFAAFLKNSRLV